MCTFPQELVGKYTHIENYFMREGLTKVTSSGHYIIMTSLLSTHTHHVPQAIAMDSCNADGLTSSMADDIFFVLQKCSR